MIRLSLFVVFLTVSVSLIAQEEKKHPLDEKMDECLSEGKYTDQAVFDCKQDALKYWDEQLNTVYNEIKSLLPDQKKQAFKELQLLWLKHRDAEYAWIESYWNGFEFSPLTIGIAIADQKLRFLKHRVIELESYLASIKAHT